MHVPPSHFLNATSFRLSLQQFSLQVITFRIPHMIRITINILQGLFFHLKRMFSFCIRLSVSCQVSSFANCVNKHCPIFRILNAPDLVVS